MDSKEYTTLWVIVDVGVDRRTVESFENSNYTDIQQFLSTAAVTEVGKDSASIYLYMQSDFMEALNDQRIEIKDYWVTYINVENVEALLLSA